MIHLSANKSKQDQWIADNVNPPVPGIDFPGTISGCVTKAVSKQSIFAAMLKANTPHPSCPPMNLIYFYSPAIPTYCFHLETFPVQPPAFHKLFCGQ